MAGTARQCILAFAALLAASYAISLLLPGVRAERSLWPRKVNSNLVLIEEAGYDGSEPTISAEQLRGWEHRNQKYFDGFAFYRVTQDSVDAPVASSRPKSAAQWRVAQASSNLFTLLGMPIGLGEPSVGTDGELPQVILSERVWKSQFGANPHVAGGVVHLGLRAARVAGVAPDGSLGLPGRADAWLLDRDAEKEPGASGYVIAHLTAAGEAEMWACCVRIAASGPNETEQDLIGVSLEEWRPAPPTLCLFAICLATLCLPAITSVSLGEYSLNLPQTSWSRRLRRWSFLSLKITLLLPIIYFLSLDLSYGCTRIGREQAGLIQLLSSFAMCLLGMRWVLKDQRQRCPVCLRRVAHPAQVGQASRTFLDWNGTEMMCLDGHTLLHVPSLPTSWFSTQRWLYLDPSWAFLFAVPRTGIENQAITGIL
jgi:hypothetical protein